MANTMGNASSFSNIKQDNQGCSGLEINNSKSYQNFSNIANVEQVTEVAPGPTGFPHRFYLS
jgi:hypothetical protein